ncbi:MAG TPA: HesA/MoeB/ThiF family protein [Polyangiaceae bacterium]|nr:HesA/MoeB/ThiF family protein [Polyangiaceae bacterium]
MSTSTRDALGQKTALVIGMGGLGCPAALCLVWAGVGRVLIADDDPVDVSNLHRQILYGDADVGRDKCAAARQRLEREASPGQRVESIGSRLLPENARELVRRADVVLEGADNFATKFLASDACLLEGRPVVHGAAIRFRATVWAVGPEGRPCYRCLFEDLPSDSVQPNCAEAGVMGPVVGLAGALMGDLALSVLLGEPRYGQVFSYDGKHDRLRPAAVTARPGCALCGQKRSILEIRESRYIAPSCQA